MSKESMIAWFNNNYEDAVHGVFYCDSEGGYQYVAGAGPHDPLDVLREEFSNAAPNILDEAADFLRSSGSAWVKKGRY